MPKCEVCGQPTLVCATSPNYFGYLMHCTAGCYPRKDGSLIFVHVPFLPWRLISINKRG